METTAIALVVVGLSIIFLELYAFLTRKAWTITKLFRWLNLNQPWVIYLLMIVFGMLFGHFFLCGPKL